MTFMEVKGHQRSNGVNYAMAFGYHILSKEVLMQTENDDDLYGVKGHQRSNVVNYVIWLPYLVKRTTDAS